MNELYLKYGDKGVFRKDEVIKDFPHLKANAISEKIKQAKKSKLIKGIQGRRSIYFIVLPGQDYETTRPDNFQLAAKITPDAIICYASALMALGKSHTLLNTMYISSSTRFKELNYMGVKYRYVPLPKKKISIQVIPYKGVAVRITTVERTLIDCLRSPRYSGGFENLYRSYESVGYINWKKLEDCLKHFKSKLLKARVGFFIELFKDRWGIPQEFFSRLEKHIPKNPDYFLGREVKSGKLIKRWNLIVPDQVLLIGGSND
ncbi:MAG: hypothetical protein P9M08_12930 [Candidatus Erginobacter occultus]|nr:hypothetical protein [Candidatus Erginobacter occultus]